MFPHIVVYISQFFMAAIGFSDPLYLHPSDTPGVSLVQDPLIGTENYNVWSRAMLISLQAKNKLGFINGACPRPALGHPNTHQWERCNATVFSWIMNSVSKEIFSGIIYCTDSTKVWAELKERFDKVCRSRIFAIHRDIAHLTQGSSSISVFFSILSGYGMSSIQWCYFHPVNVQVPKLMLNTNNNKDFYNFLWD